MRRRPKISKIFRGRKIFGPKTREIAPNFVLPDDARAHRGAKMSLKSWASTDMPRGAGLREVFDAPRTENFEKFWLKLPCVSHRSGISLASAG